MKRLGLLFVAIAVSVSLALAADVSGAWTAQTPSMDGSTNTTTFDLRADGKRLAGTVKMTSGSYPILDGTVDGDTIRFHITVNVGRSVKFVHTGVVAGDEIRFTRELEGMGRRSTFVAKRSR
jgi:hypothetical protein